MGELNLVRRLDYKIDRNCKVEDFLKNKGYSSRLCNLLKKECGLVLLNNKPIFVVSEAKYNDILTVFIKEEPSAIMPYKYEVDIIYEDEDIAVINKNPDIAVIATHAHYGVSLMNALAYKWGDFVYHPVNRLDRGTSGLMIVAKNSLAHSILSCKIAKDKDNEIKTVERVYTAIIHGELVGEGVIEAPIGQPYSDSMKRGVSESGKYAKTYYAVQESFGDFSVVELKLATGRTHQIRVHMEYIGHPLLGDELYGGKTDKIQRPALHSSSISFNHPISGENLRFSSEMPIDMLNVIKS